MNMNESGEFRWLASQVKPFVRLHLASYICILFASALVLVEPLIVRKLIDDVIPQRRFVLLPLLAIAVFLTYTGRLGFDSLGAMLNFRAVQKMTFRLRLKLLCHLQRLSAEYHDNRSVGETLHRLQVDVEQVGTLSGDVIPIAFRMLTVFILVMTTMLVLNYRLAAVVLPLIPVFILVRQQFRNRLRQASDTVQQQSGKMTSFLEEHLSSIVQVQLLACEQREARRFARVAGHVVRAQIRRRATELFFSSLLYLIIVMGMAGVLCYGGYQVMTGALSAGGLVAFYGYTLQLFIPLYGVTDIYSKLQRAGASIRRLMEITQAEIKMRDRPGALELGSDLSGAIELRNVGFSYHADRPVLTNVNLEIKSGQRVAIAGTSGNGKSTVARLVARLYDACAGAVLIDGVDVRDIQLKSLRSSVIFVPQDPVLFDITLRDNLLFGNPQATEDQLKQVAKLVRLDNLIHRLPNGWEEPLGPRGNRLSGGERQRVALARALLQRPRVLILDECTSALDSTTERCVLSGLDELLQDVTTILISHRSYPLQWADRVISMSYGQIIEDESRAVANAK